MLNESLYLNFYGIIIKAISTDREILSSIETDFAYFCHKPLKENNKPQITIAIFPGKPPYEKIPNGTLAICHTKDAAIYKNGNIRYFDSFGKVLVIYDSSKESVEIYSLDRNLLYEKSYLMIMTRVGELLDKKKLHRIHAMGVVFKGKAILCLLPMGGGKTTLTLSLLENKAFSLLSEEVPLVSSNGLLYPFPIRMGVIEGTPLQIPEEFLKPFKRTHYEPKTLIDVRYFKDQIARDAKPGYIFVGKRVHSDKPTIIKLSSFKTFMALFRLCVVGIGLPQMLEYLLRFDFSDMARQFPVFCSRLWSSLLLIKHSKTYELHLSYDRTANAQFVTDFILGNNEKTF